MPSTWAGIEPAISSTASADQLRYRGRSRCYSRKGLSKLWFHSQFHDMSRSEQKWWVSESNSEPSGPGLNSRLGRVAWVRFFGFFPLTPMDEYQKLSPTYLVLARTVRHYAMSGITKSGPQSLKLFATRDIPPMKKSMVHRKQEAVGELIY
ncbi:hypothetical protein ANN_02664 [Periplaneta americana]|uniref:Uncharacterized protein n=1 Tax=Periplaneta americana TaxID=6978 RepID=A0ABQ8U0E7_PERAM|nr:hypothetical protein ANN_02664 [Periplaneta americana]